MDDAELVGTLFLLIVVLVIAVAPTVLFLLSMQRALARCSPRSRTMEPGQVWLMLVPVLNLVWQFKVVTSVSQSLENECHRRNIRVGPEPGKSVGLAYCILACISIIPFIGVVTALASLVCWAIFWVQIARLSSQLGMPYLSAHSAVATT